jgi:hypothetical protein
MKITEQTTLAELHSYFKACGEPFVTLMANPNGNKFLHAIVHAPAGTFHGGGDTIAEALEAAFTNFRLATLPEPLRSYVEPSGKRLGGTVGVNEHTRHGITDPNGTFGSPYAEAPFAAALDGRYPMIPREKATPVGDVSRDPAWNKFRQHADELCHGCSHKREDHPNESGCQEWHDRP